jgi:multiple sugar transport system substrate-binding protein
MKRNWQLVSLPKYLPQLSSRFWGLLAIFQIAVLLTLLLTFPKQPVTLAFVVPAPEATLWLPLVEEFQQQNPAIQIQLNQGNYTTDQVEAIYTSALETGNSTYDLIYMDIIWVPRFVTNGWLKDLSDRISEEELEPFLKADVEAGRYQDGLYRIPFRSDAGVLYYRQDLLEQAGLQPPETFEELRRFSEELQRQDLADWGYVWQGQNYEGLVSMFVEVLEGHGGFWINPETQEVGLDQTAAIDAIRFLSRTLQEGISPPDVTIYDEERSFQQFQQGETVFLRSWPYIWARAQQVEALRGNIGIKPMVHAGDDYSSKSCRGGWGFGIAQNTQHPEEAWRAIQFFTSADVQRKFVLESSYLPSRRDLFNDPQLVAKQSHLPELLGIVENAVSRPLLPKYDEVSGILQQHLYNALTGQSDIETEMRAAANETRIILDES